MGPRFSLSLTLPRQIRVLLVDDDPTEMRSLKRIFQLYARDWDVTIERSARQAIKLLDQCPYDVLITDLDMPELDGIGLLKVVSERFTETLRIARTSRCDTPAELSELAHEVLSKTTSVEDLVTLVNTKLGRAPALPTVMNQQQE